jgi:hypothetical protein
MNGIVFWVSSGYVSKWYAAKKLNPNIFPSELGVTRPLFLYPAASGGNIITHSPENIYCHTAMIWDIPKTNHHLVVTLNLRSL